MPAASRTRRKPQADLYTILLVLALLALLTGILFLYFYIQSFEGKMPERVPVNVAAYWPSLDIRSWLG